jgi:hypothetical protein
MHTKDYLLLESGVVLCKMFKENRFNFQNRSEATRNVQVCKRKGYDE